MEGIAYITDRNGNPNVFNLNWNGEQLKLNANSAKSGKHWNDNNQFVFRFRKSFLFRAFKSAVFFQIFQTFRPPPKYLTNFFKPEGNLLELLV